jgi:hypothetical protein
MDDFVRWNGNVISAKSCAFSFQGVPYIGITAVDYEDQLDAEYVHGANKNGAPLGYTSGEYSISAFSVTMLKDVCIAKFIPQLALLGLAAGSVGSIGAARWTFQAQYQEGPLVGTDTIEGGRLIGMKDSYSQGMGKLVTECKMMGLVVRRNGLTLFDPLRLP